MASQTPTILVDNVFDINALYPGAVLTASSELTGREAYRVIDARRERSWWQPANDGGGSPNWLKADFGASVAAPDALWIDRGHNLWGKTVLVSRGNVDGVWTTTRTLTVPALGTIGGDPTSTTMCVTEEGALWSLFTPAAATRYNVLFVNYVAAFVPIIPGAILGVHSQFLLPTGFSSLRDEDAGSRTEIQQVSMAGYLGTDKRYGWRTFALNLNYLGATEYDSTIRSLRRTLFELDQPWVGIINYGDKPERAWLYRWDGTQFSAPMNRTYRGVQIRGREVGPLLR